jgi:ankyrin repeat protein
MSLTGTDFVMAARDSTLPRVRSILDRHPDVLNARDAYDMTALMWSAFRGEMPTMEFLLSRGADRHCTTQNAPRDGTTWQTPDSARGHAATALAPKNALCLAYVSVHMPAYRRLMQDAALGEMGTALLVAAIEGDTEWAKELLGKGVPADFAADAESDKTPLVCAAINGRIEMTELLLARGAKPNQTYSWTAGKRDGWSPLLWAVDGGHDGIMDMLIAAGADVNAADAAGTTALKIATLQGHAGRLDRLKRAGAI